MSFPRLSADERIEFPDPEELGDEAVCRGANLSTGVLLSAYEQGYFPWYGPGEPLLWWNPSPRFVLFPEEIHVGNRLRRYLNRSAYQITTNKDFSSVMEQCRVLREKSGTWIDRDMIEAYSRLHELGFAHSVEVWENGELVGGLYGVRTGSVFSGESMFSRRANASKAALVWLCARLARAGVSVVDCQMKTPYLESMGGREISRADYLAILSEAYDLPKPMPWISVFEGGAADEFAENGCVRDKFSGNGKKETQEF